MSPNKAQAELQYSKQLKMLLVGLWNAIIT